MASRVKAKPKSLTFQVTFLVEPDENSYHAWAPMLPGLHAAGTTAKEALKSARELAQLYLETLIEDGDSIPLGPDTQIPYTIPSGATAYRESVAVSAA